MVIYYKDNSKNYGSVNSDVNDMLYLIVN